MANGVWVALDDLAVTVLAPDFIKCDVEGAEVEVSLVRASC